MGWCRKVALPVAALFVLACAVSARAAEPDVPRVTMPLMPTAPAIDGRIDEAEWKHAVRNVGFAAQGTGVLTARQGVFWIGCDGTALHLAVKSQVAPDGRILTRAVPDPNRDNRSVFFDDAIGLLLDPRRADGDRRLFEITTNARGALCDSAVNPIDGKIDRAWRLPKWQLRQRVIDGYWHAEISLPLAALGLVADDLKRTWGLDLTRIWQRPREESQWNATIEGDDSNPNLPLLSFEPNAPVVQVLSPAGDEKPPKLELAVFNPHNAPLAVRVSLSDAWHRDPPRELNKSLTIAPGATETLALESRDGGPEGVHSSIMHVAGPEGKAVFYHRKCAWSMHPPKRLWTSGEEQRRAVDLQFKYYPYRDKIRFSAGVEALGLRDKVTGARAEIKRADAKGNPTGEPLWQEPIRFRQYTSEQTCDIPKLADGQYVFLLTLEGGRGLPREPVVQPFVRKVFPWEHNRLGICDEVMPPFTPLVAKGDKVGAVLREHRHGPAGLWKSLVSQGEQLLAAPMRWHVETSAPGTEPTPRTVEGQAWRIVSHKPTAVKGEASWRAGPVKARFQTEYDYDGMMLATLTLEPTGAASVHQLSLEIPLRDSFARYMHAVGDGLRSNYAGFTPSGQGRIWDSSKASRRQLVGTFYPYLWLGDGTRGLCWFADTDRDWVLEDDTPTIELIRQGESLLMRVHFITRPGPLARQHRIVFGLQATPTKPMPQGWRRYSGIKPLEGSRPVRWMGACFYWGGLSYDVYPYERRFEFFDKLKESRQTGEVDREFIDRWMGLMERKVAPKDTERHEFLLRHVNAGFHVASSSLWSKGVRLIPYTNPRGVGFHVPEFATFQDEWLRYRYFNRNWGPNEAVGYDVSPSESFCDYTIWYYREMLRCFDGVYWDNTFLSAHFDPVVGGAWSDDRGRVHPGLGLMHLRELVKRTAVMLWQETKDEPDSRRPPITLAHMTNTTIVPVLSFLNCTMDWEWKYGYDDFQDRFSADLTVAETIGRQVGAWPTVLAGGHPDPKDPRVDFMWRTRLGVALVHEIQVFNYRPQRDSDIYNRLFQFGYGTDGCRVFNYWQPGHPVKVEGIDARTLAAAKGGAALVVVTSYGKSGQCRLTLRSDTLGLKPEATAVDLETGKPIEKTAPGVFAFALEKHDFRILKIGTTISK